MSEFEGKAEDIYSERVFRILTPSETSDLISSATARFHHALGRRGVGVAALTRKTVYAALRYLPSGAPAMVSMLPSPIGAPGTGVRFDLGPFEQLFIGKCVLTNSRARAFFTVEGQFYKAKTFAGRTGRLVRLKSYTAAFSRCTSTNPTKSIKARTWLWRLVRLPRTRR
jgi:hypothetical protein